jgi:hypothetical protein
MGLEEIDFEREKIKMSMGIITEHIETKYFPLTENVKYYINNAISLFINIRGQLMSCLYPKKRAMDYEALSSIAEDFVEIANVIDPVIDTKSRKEMLNRIRKIKGIESQLKEMEENPKSFYQRADSIELAKTCKRINYIVRPDPIRVLD